MENIFTSQASSAVLIQDLLHIQRLEQELGMEVEAVDDNIFHWKVCLSCLSVIFGLVWFVVGIIVPR